MPVHIQTRTMGNDPLACMAEAPIIKSRQRRDKERLPLRRMVGPVHNRWYMPLKSAADFATALALLIVAVPIIGVLALVVKITSRGPAFYTQIRVGRNGRLFSIYKIRTMVDNCESLTGPRWSIPGDPRITPLGQLLRITHLDELPQLLNVLKGEMSLIGPRPERPEFLPRLERALPSYRDRLLIKPGVTGLAQVQLPADTDLESVRRKLAHDLYYIENVSPWLDLRVLLCTGFYALGVPFYIGGRLLSVPSVREDQSPAVLTEHSMARPWLAA